MNKTTLKLLIILIIFYSCDNITYKQPIPTNSKSLSSFPLNYRGVYVDKSNPEDTLIVNSNSFTYTKKSDKNTKGNNPFNRNGVIGKNTVVKKFSKNLFISYKDKNYDYWNVRYVIKTSNRLNFYKLTSSLDVKNNIRDYTYMNSEKTKFTINLTDKELSKIFIDGQFKLTRVFVKIPYRSQATQKKETRLSGCIKGDCQDGYGTYKYTNGDVYNGTFKNALRNNYGFYLYKDNSYYMGFYKDGIRDGYGYFSKDGNTYIGNWKNGLKNGFGRNKIRSNKNTTYYTGEWKNGIISGYGYKSLSNNIYKRGIWKNGKLISSFNYNKNNTNIGCVKGDCSNGYGKFVYKNGKSFEGFFVNKITVLGTLTFSNGDKYMGQFNSNGNFEGTGFYFWKNGDIFYGEWINDKRNNWGFITYDKKGDFIEKWVNGVRISSKKLKS